MRHPTKHFKNLQKALAQARKIVSRVPPNRCETPLQHLKVQSFILLTHAAIEEYLEELGREVVHEARRQFSKNGRITAALVSLVTSKVLDQVVTNTDKSKNSISDNIATDMDSFSKDAATMYSKYLDDNHGIQEHNQKRILIPIGVSPEKVDVATMNALNAYGKKRGTVAHSFTLIRTEHTLSSVTSELKVIVTGLENFDKAACDALKLRMNRSSLSA